MRPPDSDVFWQRLREAIEAIPEDASSPPDGARVGAVLALFEATDQGPGLVLTRRRRDLRSHPGQLSFPGGRLDEGETVEEAALREAWEEIGLDATTVEIAGSGPTFYIPPSRFWVVPIVGWWHEPHALEPNPWEVDEVLHVSLATLLDPDTWRYVPLSEGDATWAWQLDDDLLWGATAVMVWSILDVVASGWSRGTQPEDLGPDLEVRPWEDFPTWRTRAVLEGVPEVGASEVPVVSSAAAREVDRLLAADADVGLPQILEHVGRAITDAVRRLSDGDVTRRRVTVLAGPGGNGAGGLATARLLRAAGAEVEVLLTGTPSSKRWIDALLGMDVVVRDFGDTAEVGEVVVDAMLGVGARPPVHGTVADAIEWLQRNFVPVVSVDLPSGLHADDGLRGASVSADVTVALGAPKRALVLAVTRPYVGDLYLADLGIPASVWRKAGVEPVGVFGRGPLVRLLFAADTPDDAAEAGAGAAGSPNGSESQDEA